MPIPGDASSGAAAVAGTTVRAARDDDEDGLVALIGGCFAEYPGCVLDVDGEIPELRAIAAHFAGRDGRFWVAEAAGRVVGCVGTAPTEAPGGMELLKLYVDRSARGQGLGRRLVELVENEAMRRRSVFMELWTDTRFETAHRLYEGLGYERLPETRALHDLSGSVEFHYRKRLDAR
ncbi:MAG: GNAT family N-acetyltransferase [Inquilinus sp.]|nr:GNAT family N-acetyltransferase [Inquilinus sp.]